MAKTRHRPRDLDTKGLQDTKVSSGKLCFLLQWITSLLPCLIKTPPTFYMTTDPASLLLHPIPCEEEIRQSSGSHVHVIQGLPIQSTRREQEKENSHEPPQSIGSESWAHLTLPRGLRFSCSCRLARSCSSANAISSSIADASSLARRRFSYRGGRERGWFEWKSNIS